MITHISVTHNESDLYDFLNDGITSSATVTAYMDAYIERHAQLLKEWYPNAEIEVGYASTSGGTNCDVESNLPDTDGMAEVEQEMPWIEETANKIVEDWSWLPE